MDKVSYVGNADVNAIDHLYKMYLQDPESVDAGWKKFFEGFDFARTNYEDGGEIPENFQKEFKVIDLKSRTLVYKNKPGARKKKVFANVSDRKFRS